MKVNFLDVDGVLSYSKYRNSETDDIDIDKVKLLKQICDKTGSKVVISSSWRGSQTYTPRIYYTLIDVLTNNGIEVLGDTPFIDAEFEGDMPEIIAETTLEDLPNLKMKHGTGRAAEIQKWIKEHEVENFVILDDEDWDWIDYGYDKHWVRSSWYEGGLQQDHVDKAIEILRG